MDRARPLAQLSLVIRMADPRRGLMAATVWLILALAAIFTIGASTWVGGLARDIVLQQHARRLQLETDQIGADVHQAIAARLGALRVAEAILASPGPRGDGRGLRGVFEQLVAAYPDLDWLAVAGPDGVVAAGRAIALTNTDVHADAWFTGGREGPWVGVAAPADLVVPGPTGPAPALGEFAAPMRGPDGAILGVILARLSWRSSPSHLERLSEAVGPPGAAQAALVGPNGVVLVGPEGWRAKPWPGVPVEDAAVASWRSTQPATGDAASAPRFERMPDGRTMLVAEASVMAYGDPQRIDYRVRLSEPKARVYARADWLAREILWVSVFLGAVTAVAGAIGAGRLTRRLRRLTQSVAAAGRNSGTSIEVPAGKDEVTKLGTAFAELLHDLHKERTQLQALSQDLERRVAERTREVQRLAEEARYSAVVRERLKLARDMHDTLAHSMMALLSEIRLLRRLHVHDPAAVSMELARAEQVAHDGLAEARSAIAQMRVNPVRDTGLGTALLRAVTTFTNNTGIPVDYAADVVAAGVGDERAETVFNMVGEVLRNVELHASATRVEVMLRDSASGGCHLTIRDNGVGFDVGSSHTGHYGLVGLREQAQLIGAELSIESAPNVGTSITVSWPGAPVC